MVRHKGFISEKQRKHVMGMLKAKGFNVKPKKITQEGRFIRVRVQNPNKFKKGSFRVITPSGRQSGTKVIIGRKKGQVTTSTQAILIPRRK